MDIVIGNTYTNKNGEKFKVVKYSDKRSKSGNKFVVISFLDNGYTYDVDPVQIRRGMVKNRYAKSIYGIASIGNVKMVKHKRAYNIWYKVICRCYYNQCKAYQHYGARGVSVCDEWLVFENFVKDYKLIDGYDEELFEAGLLVLDKDLKQSKTNTCNKVYSKDTCTWMSLSFNSSLASQDSKVLSFIAIDPNGIEHHVTGIKKFCREHDFVHQRVLECLRQTRNQYRGWKFHY
jgi:hypothetical protein|nr:MAG TPA: hypothetical protein [Caudoviricetes sp.]